MPAHEEFTGIHSYTQYSARVRANIFTCAYTLRITPNIFVWFYTVRISGIYLAMYGANKPNIFACLAVYGTNKRKNLTHTVRISR